jgi:hypothetical protein
MKTVERRGDAQIFVRSYLGRFRRESSVVNQSPRFVDDEEMEEGHGGLVCTRNRAGVDEKTMILSTPRAKHGPSSFGSGEEVVASKNRCIGCHRCCERGKADAVLTTWQLEGLGIIHFVVCLGNSLSLLFVCAAGPLDRERGAKPIVKLRGFPFGKDRSFIFAAGGFPAHHALDERQHILPALADDFFDQHT